MTARLAILATALAVAAAAPPTITSVDPAAPARSERPQPLTVTGTDFKDGLKLIITGPNGESRTYAGGDIQSGRETSFQTPVTLAAAGSYALVVLNPDGSKSAPFSIQVKGQGGSAPAVLNEITPAETTRDGREQTITLTGSQFAPDASVIVTDPAGTVSTLRTFEKSTPQTIVVRLVLDQRGTYSIAVQNGGAEPSNPATLRVN